MTGSLDMHVGRTASITDATVGPVQETGFLTRRGIHLSQCKEVGYPMRIELTTEGTVHKTSMLTFPPQRGSHLFFKARV